MTIYVGGLRARLIKESVFHMLEDNLTSLGWFSPGRRHAPIDFLDEPINNQDEVKPNTLSLSDENEDETDEELGSELAEHRWVFYVDFYAESNAVGLHVSRDIRDILAGRFASIGRTAPFIDVYDYTMATPSKIFTVEVENIVRDRAHNFPKANLRHWYTVRFETVDHYGRDDD